MTVKIANNIISLLRELNKPHILIIANPRVYKICFNSDIIMAAYYSQGDIYGDYQAPVKPEDVGFEYLNKAFQTLKQEFLAQRRAKQEREWLHDIGVHE